MFKTPKTAHNAMPYIDKSDFSFQELDTMKIAKAQQFLESGDRGALEQMIMDLFYRSDFYEEESNNEELRTQMVF